MEGGGDFQVSGEHLNVFPNGIQFDAPDDAVADCRCGYTLKRRVA